MKIDWLARVDGSAKTLTIVHTVMAKAGPGVEVLLWEHGIRFLELRPGVPFAALGDEYFPDACEQKELRGMDGAGYGRVEGFYNHAQHLIVLRNPSEYVAAHETGHAIDQALDWYGSEVFAGKDDRRRFDHHTGTWRSRPPREPLSAYALKHPRERFAEAFAAYLDSQPGTFARYHINRLRATDRTAAALMRRIFREANGSHYELAARPCQ